MNSRDFSSDSEDEDVVEMRFDQKQGPCDASSKDESSGVTAWGKLEVADCSWVADCAPTVGLSLPRIVSESCVRA